MDPCNPAELAADAAELARILRDGLIRPVFQSIVELETNHVVAFEALARGPHDSPLATPDRLFATARAVDRLAELDWRCRIAALDEALSAELPAGCALFVNAEPEAIAACPPADAADAISRGDKLRVVVEVTERGLTSRPAELLRSVDGLRARGWGIALDDVGADPHSLALMPFLRPDVIKLDLRLVQQRPTIEVAEIVSAVNAEAERSGAVLLAEGIETPDHLSLALSMGATLGQGWLFSRPGPLRSTLHDAVLGSPLAPNAVPPTTLSSPFAEAAAGSRVRRATKGLLVEISKHLEHQALALGSGAVVLSAFQDVRHFTPATRRRYARLAERAALVVAAGAGMPAHPLPGVRGAVLAIDDPVRHEWDIAVVGPHFAGALVAEDLGDDGPDDDRRFSYVLTHDRDRVLAVARQLLARVNPHPVSGLDDARASDERDASVGPGPRRIRTRTTVAAATT